MLSICNFKEDAEGLSTRTSYSYGDTGYEAVWTEGDILGIYPLGGDQVSFPISDGAGSKTAFFDGGAWALRGTYKYAPYYPFRTDNYTIKETAPVIYIGQGQKGNNTTAHLSDYDFMAAAAIKPSSNGSVTLPFKHLDLTGSTIELKVTDSDGVSYINEEKAWTRTSAFIANTTSKVSRNLELSGTGGTIEGGGGIIEE